MKRIIKPLILFLAMTGMGAQAQNRDQQNALVEKVLDNMVNSKSMTVSSFISPAYLAASGVKAADYQINTYSPTGYSVDENKGNGVVVARIWGSDRSWVHRLTFIVTYENSSYYFMPGREPSSYSYIDPWFKVEANVVDEGVKNTGGGGKPTESEAREIVTDLLYDMVNDADNFGTSARKYIAPSYYKKEKISKTDYQINYYSPAGSTIIEVRSDGMVVSQIYGEDKGWIHELTFKVVKENGSVYVYPMGHTDNNYIHPWYEVETDVTEKKPQRNPAPGKKVEKTEKTEMVEKILDNMVNDEDDNFGTEMRLYIAPSYYKKNSIDPFVYMVNAYSPSGFSIESADNNGIIKAKIWGTDRGWVHELTFKVVEENGLLYVMPGEHHTETEYVDPWYSVRTDVE